MQKQITTWSPQQEAIFSWFENSAPQPWTVGSEVYDKVVAPAVRTKNLIVRARAGTGKTTTIIEGINRAPERNILLAAFNKRIADELKTRITNPRARASTLHAVGLACVRKQLGRVMVEDTRDRDKISRADKLAMQACPRDTPQTIVRLVSKLHTKGREIVPHARVQEDLMDIAVNFECEPDEEFLGTEWDTEFVVEHALKAMELASKVQPGDEIDFADMIFLPVRNRWMQKIYDLVVVDEAQDMTTAQLELGQGVCSGRICVVGDDRQAIYAFRGADSGSLDRLKRELGAAELGLTVTRRCAKVIVTRAQVLVEDFEAHEENGEGEMLNILMGDLIPCAAPGDYIVSRLNAPLVGVALGLLRQNKRARIAGRDIGSGLIRLVRKLAKGKAGSSMVVFMERIKTWEEKERERLLAAGKEAKASEVSDQAAMLIELSEDVDTVQQVIDRIEGLFTDDGLGQAGVITCSSVHKAKGMEARRVFVLWDTMRKHSQEELNIQYVAITRAIESLVMVKGL